MNKVELLNKKREDFIKLIDEHSERYFPDYLYYCEFSHGGDNEEPRIFKHNTKTGLRLIMDNQKRPKNELEYWKLKAEQINREIAIRQEEITALIESNPKFKWCRIALTHDACACNGCYQNLKITPEEYIEYLQNKIKKLEKTISKDP